MKLRKRKLFILVIVLLIVVTVGFIGVVVFSRSVTQQADVVELLNREGVSALDAKMWTKTSTRNGLIELTISANDVQKLVKSLKLELFDPAKPGEEWYVLTWRKQARAIQNHQYLLDNAPVSIYRSTVRPPELHLINGGQFEYIMLYVPKEGDRILIQFSYAYG